MQHLEANPQRLTFLRAQRNGRPKPSHAYEDDANNETHTVVLELRILVALCRIPRLRALYLASGDMQRYLTLLQRYRNFFFGQCELHTLHR